LAAVIRTPDQRLRAFVSSTLQELAEERVAARDAILQLRLAPVLFELGARPHPPRDLYRAYLDQSHIFIGIYWQKYGWVAPGETISGLEDEYRLSGTKPKLIYLKAPAPEREPRLKDLLEQIKSTASYKYFATAAELRELIANDLILLLTERFEAPARRSLPSGTVSFLFTDIEGSTDLAQQYPAALPALMAQHHAILHQATAAHHGFVFQILGDAFHVAFDTAAEALQAALDAQRLLQQQAWTPAPVRVRMGINTGAAQLVNADDPSGAYSGYSTLARAQRVTAAGHGGQVLLSNASAEQARGELPPGVTLRDMGQHRLKGLLDPEHLWQVLAPGLPADFPKLATLSATPNNLPTQLTQFIGRETELPTLKSLLTNVHNRLITIVAPGGMGKTRLALEVAEQVHLAYPQGVYFVALDRISAAELVVQAVAEVLPISLASQEDPKTRIVDYLRDKQVLLVLDNFEHVLDGTMLVAEILAAAPRVQILATSRVKLNLTGETTFALQGLRVDEAALEKNSALQLFAQSAQRIRPQFELAGDVLPGVTRICWLVEGMPLAIVLAAAWIDTLSVGEIAAEIETSVDILETERRDVPPRQRSVRAVIESSWNQVDASAQDLLKRLAVFRGGVTRAAAQEAAGATLRGLSQLVDKALLRREPDSGRYHIHELVRQYAEEQLALSADLERAAHATHAAYFADFMNTCDMRLRDQRQKAALLQIEADFDNIRVAWNYWTDQQEARSLLKFVDALWVYFEVRGAFTPAIQYFSEAAEKLTSNQADIVWTRAQLRGRQAWFVALIGQPDQGLRLAQESISILSQYDQPNITVQALNCVNINAIFLNQYEVVIQTGQAMTARAGRSGDIWERGWALVWWAYALVLQQQIDQAMQAGQEAVAIFEQLRNPFGLSVSSGLILGVITLAAGDIGAARANFLRGVQASEEINYLRLLQICYDNLGTIALLERDVDQAEQYFLKSLRISQECGQTREMLASLRDFANVYMARGDLDGALQLLAVVLNHPTSEQNSLNRPERLRDESEKLRAQIETQLDPARYRSAWETGQSRQLTEVVAQILN
jgi:predicted ATPase/class 3 adenylate cyclase